MIDRQPLPPNASDAPIGVFDSGVGGLSVLRHIREQLPHEDLLYFADSAFAPYGTKPEQAVAERSLAVADLLVARGAKALVVACNTATVAAIGPLRARFPALPIVGVEPGLKPAAAASRNGKVGVLATGVTLAGEKFQRLRAQVAGASGAEFLLQACPGLVELIERGECDSAATLALLARYVLPLLERGADTLVLGCTHYPFVRAQIAALVADAGRPDVVVIDTGAAVARQLVRLLGAAGLPNPDPTHRAHLEAFTNGGAAALAAAFSSLLGLAPPVYEVALDGQLIVAA